MATKKPTPKKVIPKKPVPRKQPSMGAAVAKAMANDKPIKTSTVAEMAIKATSKHPKAVLVVEPRSIKDEVSKPTPLKAPPPPVSHTKTISVHDLAQMASLTQPSAPKVSTPPWEDSPVPVTIDHNRRHSDIKESPAMSPETNQSFKIVDDSSLRSPAAIPDREVQAPLLKVDVSTDRKKPLDFNAVKEAMRKINPFVR